MTIHLTKTDYLLFRECPNNAWFKLHKPDLYSQSELSEFEKSIIEAGIEVELITRQLFPTGILIEGRDAGSQKLTQDLISQKAEVLFQPLFIKDGCLAAIDILKLDPESTTYSVYEVKSKNSIDKASHYHDLTFQVNLLRNCGLNVSNAFIIHLNPEYVFNGELEVSELLKIVDVTSEVASLSGDVLIEVSEALEVLARKDEPEGPCCCIYKGRASHCSTFQYSNPAVPEYGVHDISRIGNSKAKLKELVDNQIFHLDKIPSHIKLSDSQRKQVDAYLQDKTFAEMGKIREELASLVFPLYFLDYETCPSAIPRFQGFSPYTQIPFQYSLHKLVSEESEPEHSEFLHIEEGDPTGLFAESLKEHIGEIGSVIVWHKSFECGRNNEIAHRIPELSAFIENLNKRIYDLEEIFKKQYFIHKDFKGKTSIKYILPVLVPELTYNDLEIGDGGSAAETWNKLINGSFSEAEKTKAISALKSYCYLDTYAMYSIWKYLNDL